MGWVRASLGWKGGTGNGRSSLHVDSGSDSAVLGDDAMGVLLLADAGEQRRGI